MKRKPSRKKLRQSTKTTASQAKPSKPAKEKKKPQGFVSIIIPTVKQTTMVEDCVLAVKKNTQHVKYEIIIVDDSSSKDVQECLSDLAKKHEFNLILKGANEGFGKTCNRGLQEGQGDYFVLLNNDVLVEPGWLPPLVKIADKDPHVGIVGARLLHEDGTIQHAGIIFDLENGFDHRLKGLGKDNYQALQQCEVDAVSFALALLSRPAVNQIGLLDGGLSVRLEDIDYCLRARRDGFKTVYCPSCVAIRKEDGQAETFGSEKDLSWLKNEIDAQDRFAEKWLGSGIEKEVSSLTSLPGFLKRQLEFGLNLSDAADLMESSHGD